MTGWQKIGQTSRRQFLHVYKDRNDSFELSLHEYFYKTRKNCKFFPHHTGTQLQAKYPPTVDYARSVLLTHKPWWGEHLPYNENTIIDDFLKFIVSFRCNATVKVNYERAKQKHQKQMNNVECVAGQIDDLKCEESDNDNHAGDVQLLMDVYGHLGVATPCELDLGGRKIDRGLDYKWCQRVNKVSQLTLSLILCEFFGNKKNSHSLNFALNN